MSQDLSLNMGFAQDKFYAVAKNMAAAAAQSGQEQTIKPEETRETSLRWEKVTSKGKSEGDQKLTFSLSSELGSTTVLTPDAVKAPASPLGIRQHLQDKFVELLEQTYANCFHHNRLVAKVAEWTLGNILGRLALLGMPPEKLEKIKKRIRGRLIEQNRTALFQVVYDETMMEIV